MKLSEIETMADAWGEELNLSRMANKISNMEPYAREAAISVMIRMAFVEGIYRTTSACGDGV